MSLALPPLRERREDVLPLAELFLREANKEAGRAVRSIDARAMKLLEAYRWPGNVRELRNVIDRAVVITRGEVITPDDLPERVRASSPMPSEAPSAPSHAPSTAAPPPDDALLDYKERVRQKMQAYETELIVQALERHDGNQTEAAKSLQMPVRTLAHKIQQYGIKKKFTSQGE
jgi:DNA-binding NtrC family response regulator